MGQILHHDLGCQINPRKIASPVERVHIMTNAPPILAGSPSAAIRRRVRIPIIMAKISHRNHFALNTGSIFRCRLTFASILS